MHKNIPIVMQGLTRYDADYGATSLSLAKEWAKERLVFYIDHPFTYKDKWSGNYQEDFKHREVIFSSKELFLRPFNSLPNFINITPAVMFPINFLNDGLLYQKLKKVNLKKIIKTLNKVLSHFNIKEIIYINSFNPVYDITQIGFKNKLSVYHCVDLISGERYIAKHGIKAEEGCAKNADQVITTSDQLKENLLNFNKNTEVVYNGADYMHFQKEEYILPKEYETINTKKIVVYVGNLGLRIDYNLVEQIALDNKELNFVFIGPIDTREFKGEKVMALDNVFFLGKKKIEEVPDYIYYADYCLIPFVINELTKCIYPLKINEYFSLGKPVLTTPFTDLSNFKNLVIPFTSTSTFKNGINKVVESDDSIEKRKAFAKSNRWEIKAKEFLQYIEQML
ncbi:glycosyltransferase [Flammeovirga pectinis]|uniref:Glycosyltransferase n=1 Tax=Flammeovirga pectinis TaxID=2494373 RepID=A0A3S9PB09_9BACT|nr:glycosyltransferase [Flammeovirga pectinis]AZQ65293.1 glycosyltransferase [Flammeovirga pectinis]